MNKLIFVFFVSLLLASCGKKTEQMKSAVADTVAANVTQVLYFYGKQRCVTCNEIERLTKEVVDSLSNDQIVLKIIDLSLPENESIADRYEITWSSLLLDRNGKVSDLTETAFSYAKGQPEVFKAHLREELAKIAR